MKIGIVTFHWAQNYGAVLQAYALQTFLQHRRHDVEIVDFRPAMLEKSFTRKWISKSPAGCIKKWRSVYQENVFEKFRKKRMVLSKPVLKRREDLILLKGRYDVFITGSDQIWNPNCLAPIDDLFDVYFLSFPERPIKRISYAASMGHENISTIEKKYWPFMRENLLHFDAVSVREGASIGIIRELCGRNDAVHVLDPTLLLPREYYNSIAATSTGFRRYVFSFMLHGLENDADSVLERFKKHRIIRYNAKGSLLKFNHILPSPEKWISCIREAECVVTNSFHAVVFCLLYHVPFFAILQNEKSSPMNVRLIELLTDIHLSDRIISPGQKIDDKEIVGEIAWESVERVLDNKRNQSINFLAKQQL